MASYSEQFFRFLPVLITIMVFVGLVMLAIWKDKRERRINRIAEIEVDAEKVFGSQGKAKNWMAQENAALGRAPISMLDSAQGEAEVRRVLAAISLGGVA